MVAWNDRGAVVRPVSRVLAVLAVIATSAAVTEAQVPPPPATTAGIDADRLKRHVEVLASPEFGGRSGSGGRKAEAYIVHAFRQAGLEPAFGDRYTQDLLGPEGHGVYGRNVVGRIVGSDATLKDQWVVVGAHYDHLGVRDGVLYPGADDNASGVAMLLEVARGLAEPSSRPRRSVMFVAFDLEEAGLWGSRFFVEHPPVPLDSIVLNVTADMIGRSLGGVCDPYVFVMGAESAAGLDRWVLEAEPRPSGLTAAGSPLKLGLMGADLLVVARSDYGPFKNRRIPFLFFSTGENPCYHRPTDTPETLDYPKLLAVSRVIDAVVRRAVHEEDVPRWSESPAYPADEAQVMRDVLSLLLEHRETLNIGTAHATLMTATLKTLDRAIERGRLTPSERLGLIRVAQIILLSVL